MSALQKTPWQPARLLHAIMALQIVAVFFCLHPASLQAGDEEDAENAVIKMARKLEKDDFDFRADIWVRDLKPDVGKAVRVQFFKGNEYRVCVAVPPGSGVSLVAHVLGIDGKPLESKAEPADGPWGVTLYVKPQKTGVYAVVMRQAETKGRTVPCAMITGYK